MPIDPIDEYTGDVPIIGQDAETFSQNAQDCLTFQAALPPQLNTMIGQLNQFAIPGVQEFATTALMLAWEGATQGYVGVIVPSDGSPRYAYQHNGGEAGTIADWTLLSTQPVSYTSPQLGGNLDTNGHSISNSSGDVTIDDSLVVTGEVAVDSGEMTVKALSDENNAHYWLHRYDDTPIGLFFANPTEEATYVRKYDVDGTTVTSELKLTDGFANVVNCVLQEQGSRVYSANNNNIGTGSTNYAAGDHTHDADEVSAPALIGFTTDASEGSTTLTASHFNSGTIFNQTSGGEKSFTLPAGLTGIVGRAIEVLSLSALTYVYFPSGVTLTAYTPDDGGLSGGGGVYSSYVRASYSFQYFKIICVADDEYAVVGYMRYV